MYYVECQKAHDVIIVGQDALLANAIACTVCSYLSHLPTTCQEQMFERGSVIFM
jgi:hypothetical protein